jgi:hypothetical protein
MFLDPKWNKKIARNLLVLFSCHHAMLFCSSFLPLLTIGYFLARVFLVAKLFPKWLKIVFSGPSSHQIFFNFKRSLQNHQILLSGSSILPNILKNALIYFFLFWKEEHETWNKDSYLKSKSLLNTCHYGCQFIVYAN